MSYLFQYDFKPLFAELRFFPCCSKKKVIKCTFEFTQSRLSYYNIKVTFSLSIDLVFKALVK